jgi:hypothetical protein
MIKRRVATPFLGREDTAYGARLRGDDVLNG